jgi:CheY-like chemotaxis protein
MPSLLEGVQVLAMEAGATDVRARRRRTVLVADDDADVRAALAEALADEGWDVHEAENGREALERIEAGAYDVVLLDHRMPEMTGGDVCRELRARGRGVRVVMLTAAAAVRDLAAEVGADAWLGKPYGLDELFDVLERASDGPSGRAAG